MAGLIFKELQYRKLAQRVLIIAPGHLKYQWQREMKERFQTSFAIVDRARLESTWGENVWEERDQLITSIDFAKQDDIKATLLGTHWDLVIVDEAHKMSATAYPSKNRTKIDKTKRYQLGEMISKRTEHLLFLTATPHRGDEENFRLFLDLLRPGFFAKTELLKESIQQKDNPVFIRRLKEDMRTFEGKAIFPPRHVHSVGFKLTPEEKDLYNEVTRYVKGYFDKAKENRSISFALMVLQRRLTSSTHAIYKSLIRRKKRLEELLTLPERIRQDQDYLRARKISDEELEDMEAEEREQLEERLLHLTIAENIEDVEAEIQQLDTLIQRAEEVRSLETESKLVGLRDHVLEHLGDRKLLIFTEFRDTVEYLIQKLKTWGYEVVTIHGLMNMDARIKAEHDFRDQAQIMVATEAAGEGINLQFCSLMVNYDIPWNPNRLEQRMGRIHRYGQNLEVHIWNLITQDTREGQIMTRLFQKMERMKEALGSDRVFDIMGEIIPGSRLDELLKEAIFGQRRIEEIEQKIEAINPDETQRTLKRVFSTGLATRHIDYSQIRKETLLAEENRLVPEYVEDFFLRALRRFNGKVDKINENAANIYRVDKVPFSIRRWDNNFNFKNSYGQIFRSYQKLTFDKHYARQHAQVEFVAPGHPLLEAINQEILTEISANSKSYAYFGDPTGDKQGVLWFAEGEVTDGKGDPAGKRVFCLYQSLEGEISSVNPAILWDLEPLNMKKYDSFRSSKIEDLLKNDRRIEDFLITNVLLPFREEIRKRRDHEAAIKEKYGLRSLEYLIQDSNQKILDYQGREALGEAVELPLINERRNLEELTERKKSLTREIRLERELIVNGPRILGSVGLIPLRENKEATSGKSKPNGVKNGGEPAKQYQPLSEDSGVDPDRKAKIEAIGMQVALNYEKQQNWHPEDVSQENHGFDIRSTLYDHEGAFDDVRYIEVKARAQSGAIRLSANEWKKARHFRDNYWLYIITQAGGETPQLNRIKNPAKHFKEGEDIFTTGFIIPNEKWTRKVS